jgi:hypothetical protein
MNLEMELLRENSEIIKRNEQYAILVDWEDGKITGRDCIEKIIALEHCIFLSDEENE